MACSSVSQCSPREVTKYKLVRLPGQSVTAIRRMAVRDWPTIRDAAARGAIHGIVNMRTYHVTILADDLTSASVCSGRWTEKSNMDVKHPKTVTANWPSRGQSSLLCRCHAKHLNSVCQALDLHVCLIIITGWHSCRSL